MAELQVLRKSSQTGKPRSDKQKKEVKKESRVRANFVPVSLVVEVLYQGSEAESGGTTKHCFIFLVTTGGSYPHKLDIHPHTLPDLKRGLENLAFEALFEQLQIPENATRKRQKLRDKGHFWTYGIDRQSGHKRAYIRV